MASTSGRIDIEKFSVTNFEMQKLKIEDLLIYCDLQDEVDEKKLRPTNPNLATEAIEYDVRDKKAKSLIRLCLADSILINVHEEPTMKKLWKKLSEIYQEKSLVNNIFLKEEVVFLENGRRWTDF